MKVIKNAEIRHRLEQLNAGHSQLWEIDKNRLHTKFVFADFQQAFEFMTSVARAAEKLDHHPDWSNSYNRVDISLTTHSCGGITRLDFSLAEIINQLTAG